MGTLGGARQTPPAGLPCGHSATPNSSLVCCEYPTNGQNSGVEVRGASTVTGRAASPPALHHSAPSPFHPLMWPAQAAIGDSRERLPRIPIPGLNPADAWTRSYCESRLLKASFAALRFSGSGSRAMIHINPDRALSSPAIANSIASASRFS